MKEDRSGVLVCACRADGKIVLNDPYACEDVYIQDKRERRISVPGRASNKPEKGLLGPKRILTDTA